MDLTRTAYGTWSGGRFMHFGEPLDDTRFLGAIRHAYEQGIRTFMTADVYGNGAADTLLAEALAGLPRESYSLVGMIGHDFYSGQREGSKGYPRFTDPRLRTGRDYADYVRMATEKSLERCRTDHFDCLMLHNPDSIGYTNDAVWKAMNAMREDKLATRLGVAPGPANGFSLDVIHKIKSRCAVRGAVSAFVGAPGRCARTRCGCPERGKRWFCCGGGPSREAIASGPCCGPKAEGDETE